MRLTRKTDNGNYCVVAQKNMPNDLERKPLIDRLRESQLAADNKLGQLEDIEEELGIDLSTLFKALRQFFAKDLDCYCPRPISLFQDVYDEWYIQWIGHYYKLKDCGKTWALTKEELL